MCLSHFSLNEFLLYMYPFVRSAQVWDDPKAGDADVRVHLVAKNETVLIKVRTPKSAGLGAGSTPGDTLSNLRRKIFRQAGIPVPSQSLWLNNVTSLTDANAPAAPLVGDSQTVYVHTLPKPSDKAGSTSDGTAMQSATFRNYVVGRLNCCEPQTPYGVGTYMADLYIVAKDFEGHVTEKQLLGRLFGLTNNALLVNLMAQLMDQLPLTSEQQVAVMEGLYFLFRRMLPRQPNQGEWRNQPMALSAVVDSTGPPC